MSEVTHSMFADNDVQLFTAFQHHYSLQHRHISYQQGPQQNSLHSYLRKQQHMCKYIKVWHMLLLVWFLAVLICV